MDENRQEHRKAKPHLFECLLIPMMVDVMEFFSGYPPFKEEEEKTIYEKDGRIDGTGEGTEDHRPKWKEKTDKLIKKYSGCYTPFDAFHQPHLPRPEDSIINIFSACRHLFPVVERLDAFVCLQWVMFPILNNFHSL